MKIVITFLVCWGLIFWLCGYPMDNFYAYTPSRHNWKGALTSFALTLLGFGFAYLMWKNL